MKFTQTDTFTESGPESIIHKNQILYQARVLESKSIQNLQN